MCAHAGVLVERGSQKYGSSYGIVLPKTGGTGYDVNYENSGGAARAVVCQVTIAVQGSRKYIELMKYTRGVTTRY